VIRYSPAGRTVLFHCVGELRVKEPTISLFAETEEEVIPIASKPTAMTKILERMRMGFWALHDEIVFRPTSAGSF
jgi:hypothetical protein